MVQFSPFYGERPTLEVRIQPRLALVFILQYSEMVSHETRKNHAGGMAGAA